MQLIPVPITRRRQLIAGHAYFQDIAAEAVDRLAAALTLQVYEDGEALFWEGASSAGLFILHRGMVKLYRVSPQGREVIIRVIENGETFNEVSVFDNGANPVNAAALGRCEVWHIPVDVFLQELEMCPQLMRNVIRTLCRRTRHLVQMVEELSLYRVTCRLARLVLQLSPEELHGGKRLTQDEMAARLGTVREVVARALKELQRAGVLRLQRGRIYVENASLLREWAMLP